MSQPPSNWPPPGPGNPFSDQPQGPYGPGGPYPGGPYGPYGPPQRIEDDPAMRWVLPVGTSVWAIAAGYLGLFSLLCLPGPIAIFCGVMAIRELRRNPNLSGWGRAIFGLVMGTLGTLTMIAPFVIGLFAAAFEK
jgi:hypothetical protein